MREIIVKDTMLSDHPTVLEFVDHLGSPRINGVFFRAKDRDGVLRENGAISIEDAERLAFWLHGVVDDFRARQAGDKR